MSLKKSIVIDDRHCICKNCKHSNTCKIFTKYSKLLDMLENIDPDEFIIKMTAHIRKCNKFLEDAEK